jgi:hypothetical protein
MFGYHKAKREKKRAKREREALQQEIDLLKQEREKQPSGIEEHRTHQEQINEIAKEQKERDKIAQQEGRERAEELLNRDYKGLGDVQRRSLQESANSQINKDIQGYEKRLLAQQGRRGVKGGAAYAQQQDLARLGTEAQQQMQRDLSVLDADLALKKLAAAYNVEQGEVGQEALRQQMARDVLSSYDQKRYNKWLAEQANRLFQRI